MSVLAAWVIEYAVARTGGRLLIECGRYGADPLRTVRAVGTGCGQRYLVMIRAPDDRLAGHDPVGGGGRGKRSPRTRPVIPEQPQDRASG